MSNNQTEELQNQIDNQKNLIIFLASAWRHNHMLIMEQLDSQARSKHYKMVQGTSNHINLSIIANMDCDTKKAATAIRELIESSEID